uniref:rhomboid family intramembrane serine protease n=1 Tax=Candidatus Magnetaquicoccus inordinatus TaxID=2496818 RepID=UPI001D0F1CBE
LLKNVFSGMVSPLKINGYPGEKWTLTLLLLLGLAEKLFGSLVVFSITGLAAPLLSLGFLLLTPDMYHYRGASALGSLWATLCAWSLWCNFSRFRPLLLFLLLLAVVQSLAVAFAWWSPLSSLPEGVYSAWQAHVMGMILGVATMRYVKN